jgi:hypothetical protein
MPSSPYGLPDTYENRVFAAIVGGGRHTPVIDTLGSELIHLTIGDQDHDGVAGPIQGQRRWSRVGRHT